MNQTRPENEPLPLACDDPRISEWIDGRLAGREAEAVARAVAASAELSRFVTELRALKEAAVHVPTAAAPHGFVQRVMDAIGTTAVDGGEDAAVEAEWRKLEAERIEEEREEALDDVVVAPPAALPRRWPWLALATSLAAGVLAAAFLNSALVRRREVALEAPAKSSELVANAVPASPPVPLAAEAVRMADEPVQLDTAAAPKAARTMAAAAPQTGAEREVTIVVDGDRGRESLARLLAEHGITRGDAGDAGTTLAEDRLELTAPAAAIDAFLAAVGRSTDEGLSVAAVDAAAESRAGEPIERLVIRIRAAEERK